MDGGDEEGEGEEGGLPEQPSPGGALTCVLVKH